jgi:hypothetical protein
MAIWMVPLAIWFVADLYITYTTGQTILEHGIGVDPIANLTDGLINMVLGTSNQEVLDALDGWGTSLAEHMDEWGLSLAEHMDEWGIAQLDHVTQWGMVLQDLLYTVIVLVIILIVLALFNYSKTRKTLKAVNKMNKEGVV